MVTYNYQSYFTNWASSLASGITGANIGSAEQGRHSTRLYSDPYALQYVGYHTVQRVDYSYTQNSFSGSNSMNQSEFFYNLHLDHGYQFNEYWKSTKSSIKRFNNSSRFGDRQTVEHQTPGPAFVANTYLEPQSYQYYKISTTKDYELSVAWNTDIYNLGHDALFDKTDGNTYYTNKANEVKAYQYDFKKPKTEYTFAFNMDSANPEQIWSYVNATNSTINSYTYDNWGYLATQTDSLGNSSQYTYAGPYHQISNQTTQSQDSNTKSIKEYTYYLSSDGDPNRRNQLATVKSTQNYLNPNTNQIDSDVAESDIVTYNSNKLPTQTKDWSPSGAQFSNSNVQTLRDMAYSSYGLLNTETDHVTLGLNQTASSFSTSYAYDALGRKTRITNPDNSHSDYGAYDVLDRVGTYTFTPDPALGAAARTTAIGYSDTDRKVTITTPDGEKNESIYTPYGLLYQQQQTKNGNSRIVLSNTTNDGKTVIDKLLFNSTAQKTSYDYDSMGRVSTVADAIGQVVTYTYANNAQNQSTGTNYLQNTVQVQYPDGKKEFTYYNRFNQVVKVDEIGFSKSKTTINDYSTFGKLIQSTLTSNGKSEATNYRYDTFGNLIYVKDAEGNINQYVYDRMGNLLIYKVNGVEQKRSTYNEAGWMLTTTNASGNQEEYSYKNTGLLNTYVDKMSQTYSYTYTPYFGKDRTSIKDTSNNEIDWQQNTYDPQNLLLTGQTNSANDTTTYHYDQWKRMDSEAVAGRLYGLGYDGFDRLQTLTYPDQQQVGYTYDNINRFTSVSFPGMGTVGYDYLVIADSNSIKLSYPNGAVPDAQSQTSVRDVFGELKQVDNYQKDQNNNLVMNFHEDINYDGFGNIKTLHRNSSTYSFQYDLNNRIKQESNVNGQIDYTYDDRGNRLILQNTNLLDVSMDSTTLSYNALNQLKTFSNDSGTTVSYTYYSDGLRATKMVNGTKTRYVYLNGKIIEELSLDANGNVTGVTARNIWGNSILFRKDNTSGKSGYFFSNGHGDIVRVTDVNRNVLNSYEYDIWGNVIVQSETMSNPFKYTGEVLDNESGYYYLRARYYDPSIGRFINEDTYEGDIKNPLSLNLYTYVHNNPLTNVDPTGHYCISADGNNSHGGTCSSSTSTYVDDKYMKGQPIITNGTLYGSLGQKTVMVSKPYNYWSNNPYHSESTADAMDRIISDNNQSNWMKPALDGVAEIIATFATAGITAEVKAATSGFTATASGANNIATMGKLVNKLTIQEAKSIFTSTGRLEQSVINKSSSIIPGNELNNKAVINALTQDGSSMSNWAKMSTETYKSPSGNSQVHFYQNQITGKVSDFEMKIKFNK